VEVAVETEGKQYSFYIKIGSIQYDSCFNKNKRDGPELIQLKIFISMILVLKESTYLEACKQKQTR
jgi:hypothetical protein